MQKETLFKILIFFCIIQFFNSIMDLYVWITNRFFVPSWVLSVIMFFDALIILILVLIEMRKL